MEKTLTPADVSEIADAAIYAVVRERARARDEKGYTPDHDDRHVGEELASAAAYFMIPQFVDQDVCVCSANDDLHVESLHSLIAENAYDGIGRDDYTDPGIRRDVQIDTRINQLVKGAALALAELERWLRARELIGKADGQ